MFDPVSLLLFLVLVALPAYYINKFLLKITRPRESFPRFLLYVALCLAISFIATTAILFVIFKIKGPPNK